MKRILSLLICVSVILSAFPFVMPVYASNEEKFIDYIYVDDFSTTEKMNNYATSIDFSNWNNIYDEGAGTFASNYSLTSDKTLEVKGTGVANQFIYTKLQVTASGKPKLIVSFDVKPKFTSSSGYRFGTRNDNYGTSTIGIYDNSTAVYAAFPNNETTDKTYTKGQWMNVTLIYDNDSEKANNRDIYINGQYAGTYISTATQASSNYNYSKNGTLWFAPGLYGKTADAIEYDNIEIYGYPESLKYQLVSAEATEVKLELNMFPDSATVIPQNFIVKAGETVITPTTAKVVEGKRQISLTFSEPLTPGTLYTVSASGLTAGSSATDVADTLTLSSTPAELSFSVAPAKVEWSATNEFWSYNYENLTPVTGLGKDETANGVYEFGTGGLYNIEEVDGQKVLTMQQNSTSATDTYAFIRPNKSYYASVDAYAVEMKVKVDFSKNPENTMFDARSNPGYGLKYTAMHNGGIYTDDGLADSIGIYKDGEWITLKNVYYNSPVNIDGTDCLRRDIYINGQFAKTVYDDWNTYKGFIDGQTWHSYFRFRVRDRYNKINTEGKVYIDYIRIYKSNDTFVSKLTESENIDTNFINAQFNNIPVEADLTDKIYIADENGNKVSDIAVCEFINEFNAQGYAAKVNLWFKDELELGKIYKLCINGVNDIKGNTLHQEETFTTKSAPEAQELVIVNGIASVKVNECSEPLTLYVVGYDVVDGVEQMTTVVTEEITATGDHSTTEPVTGSIVKAFLWKGTKPVIQFVTGGTN